MSDLIVRLPAQEDPRHLTVDAALRAAHSTLGQCIENSPVTVIVAESATKEIAGLLAARGGAGIVHRSEDLPKVLGEFEAQQHARTSALAARPAGGAPTLGLEPRYLRKRRQLANEPTTLDAEVSPEPVDVSLYPSPPPSVDLVTPALRRLVIETEEPPGWRIPARVTWPLAMAVSLCIWYGLLQLVLIATDLSLEL
jgi:hypothetical protein